MMTTTYPKAMMITRRRRRRRKTRWIGRVTGDSERVVS
jgi:hypothetical protein